ncbi:MAG: hypothetical protein F6J93_23525 [Oscillatoria sp. SIO1A7]|nr:hypothetical protein [Oscillatoria sp. SIO1A7]
MPQRAGYAYAYDLASGHAFSFQLERQSLANSRFWRFATVLTLIGSAI